MGENEQKALQEFARNVRRSLGSVVLEIGLFGSASRGEADADSDLDVFILVESRSDETDDIISGMAFEVNLQYDVVISPVIFSRDEFQRPAIRESPFVQNLQSDKINL